MKDKKTEQEGSMKTDKKTKEEILELRQFINPQKAFGIAYTLLVEEYLKIDKRLEEEVIPQLGEYIKMKKRLEEEVIPQLEEIKERVERIAKILEEERPPNPRDEREGQGFGQLGREDGL